MPEYKGAAPSSGQWFSGRARLFIADNSPMNPAIAVVDLPSYNLTQRIQLPGTALQLGASLDNAFVGVFRNRDNIEQFFSVISTGIQPILPVAGSAQASPAALKDGELGWMRPAKLAKNLILVNGSDGIGGVEYGRRLVYHDAWKVYIMYAENHGRIYTYNTSHLHAASEFKPLATFSSLPVGHFHVLPYGRSIIAPHTGASKAFILDAQGRITREYRCPACHGAATYVSKQGLTAVFGCNTTVLVVRNMSANGTYLPAAFPNRVGSFVEGVPGVFWSSNSVQRFFWRTDVRPAAPKISNVTHRGGIIRLMELPSRGRFLALHNDGNLTLYDGDTGAVLASLRIRADGFPANQTAPFLQSDSHDEHIFISVPALGVVHVVHVDHGGHEDHGHTDSKPIDDEPEPASMTLERTVAVGGFPTSMTLAYMPGVEDTH